MLLEELTAARQIIHVVEQFILARLERRAQAFNCERHVLVGLLILVQFCNELDQVGKQVQTSQPSHSVYKVEFNSFFDLVDLDAGLQAGKDGGSSSFT